MIISQKTKNDIRNLRSKGFTYAEINNLLKLNVPKSSISYICKGVSLTKRQQDRINKIIIRNAQISQKVAVKKNKDILNLKIKQFYDQNLELKSLMQNRNNKLIALAMLYLGEGAKWKSQRGLMLGSSNPKIIQTYISLLSSCYGIKVENMRCRVQHRADQNSEELIRFWSQATKINKKYFYKCNVDKRTKGYPTKKSDYHGVCVVTCSGTNIQLELEQIADIINESTWGVSSVG